MIETTQKNLKQRIGDISELIFEVANGNFDFTIDQSEADDELDAIISGVNMLGQELKRSTVSRDHVQSIYDGVIDIILVMDLEMNVKKVNDAFTQFTGISENKTLNKSFHELVENNSETLRLIMKELSTNEQVHNAEIHFKKSDQQVIPTSASFSFLKNNLQEREGIMVIAKDITIIKKTEQDLIRAKEAAEEANLAKGRFLSSMSHEIRTPLNGIIGFSELLSNSTLDSFQKEYVDMILNSSSNLAKLLNDVLDLNKIDLDKVELEIIPFNFRATMTSNLNPYTYTAKDKGIELVYEFDESVPEMVITDPTRLNQILVNLIGNAIKFTNSGFVNIKFSTSFEADQTLLTCEVIDSGIGIPKEKQADIFNSFTQSDNSITRKFGGSGLGLTICKQLVGLLNGEISVTSPVIEGSHGSSFKFSIPVQIGQAKKEQDNGPDTLAKYVDTKVLAVDDNNGNLVLIRLVLEKAGIDVVTAINGIEAVEKAKKEDFDLILMDIQMPVMDGLSATKTLRKDGYSRPILALSANVDKENIVAIKESGMNDFLQKPFKQDQLGKLLNKWIIS